MNSSEIRDIKKRATKGFAWSLTGRLVCEVLQFGTGVVLARLLAPAEFGLFGMVAVFTGLAVIFRDLGIGPAVVRQKHFDDELFATVFWFNVMCGVGIAGVLFLAAPVIAAFYGEPVVRGLCRLSALNFVVGSLSLCYKVVLLRQVDYRTRGMIESTGRVVYASIAVTLALRGWGPWALVWGAIAENSATFALMVVFVRRRLSLRFCWSRLRPLLGFGSLVVGSQLVKYMQSNVSLMLVGLIGGKASLGLFKKAVATSTMPVRHLAWSVTDVLFPSMAKLTPGCREMQSGILKVARCVSLLTFPACIGLAVTARPFILGVYGQKWEGVVGPLQICCLVALTFALQGVMRSVLFAIGRADHAMRGNVVGLLSEVGAVVVGYVHWGIMGAAYGILLARSLELLVLGFLCLRAVKIPRREIARALLPCLGLAVAMGGGVLACRFWLLPTDMPPLVELGIEVPLGALLYVLLVVVFRPAGLQVIARMLGGRLTTGRFSEWRRLRAVIDFLGRIPVTAEAAE